MKTLQKLLCLLLAVCLLPAVAGYAGASELDAKGCIQELLRCLIQESTSQELEPLLTKLEAVDSGEGSRWRQIVADWYTIQEEMPVNEATLPDGLPQDDSMAIVVMGYQLNSNGSIKPELLDRLQVALNAAQKYPNAYVICTGGPTSNKENVSEAGEMAAWLRFCGIAEERIIIEDASFDTVENARNTYRILEAEYPDICSLAIVTSDYHVRRSCLMFCAAARYAGVEGVEVISNAVCSTKTQEESLRTKAWGLAILAGVNIPS